MRELSSERLLVPAPGGAYVRLVLRRAGAVLARGVVLMQVLSRRHRWALVAVSSAAVVVAGAPVVASAATAHPAADRHNCAAPKQGFAACFAIQRTGGSGSSTASSGSVTPAAAGSPSGFGPADLQSAYNIPSGLGAGKTIGIVDAYDDPTVEADLGTYRAQIGLPACTTANGCFRKVNQSGNASPLPAKNTGWAGEIALDVDMASAGCPLCKILLVEASTASMANLGTAVNTAVSLGANVVSNSYGGGESSSDPTTTSAYFNHPGVAILASSGDSGYGVEYPAASTKVISVGGTALSRSSNARGWTETVWSNSATQGAGSGCSAYSSKPSWQTDTGCAKRTVADVSAVADPNPGVAVYDATGSGGWAVYGGTSVASPLVASMFAQGGSATAQSLYQNPSQLNDVVSGQTASCGSYLCKAQAGYDGPTGLGTPNGLGALGGSSGPPPANDFSLAVAPTSGSVVAGSATSATISTAVTAGSAQSVSLSASGAPPGVTVSESPATVTAGGSSILSISTTAATAAGQYAITVTGTAASGSHSTAYTLTVTAPSGSCTAKQLIANPGFESGASSWTATAGVIGANTGTGAPRSGAYSAWLDGYGRSHTDTLSQSLTIPAGCSTYTLGFWLKIVSSETTTTTAYDKLTVTLGSTTLATYSNLNKGTAYVQRTFNAAAFAGQTVTLSFKGVEDASLQTSFVVDDTSLNAS